MSTHIVKGRDFATTDVQGAPIVAIVNRVFAERYLKGRDPIGVQFSAGYPIPDPTQEVTIIGVVDDVRQKTLADPAEPAFYVPTTQFPIRRGTAVVATTLSDPAVLENAISASDPLILAIATLLIVAITVAATLLPAIRASKMSPASALQSE